ncbi:MAG: ParB/RepB/Spo0J family partition protein [Hormoscilla sp.]
MISDIAREIPLEQIQLPDFQPRQYFDEAAMLQLTASVKQSGIIQPVVVRPVGGNLYELVAGERRYQAATSAGLQSIPAVIKNLDRKEALELALLENIQREDLNAIEETQAIVSLLALHLECDVAKVTKFLYKLKHVVDKNSADLAQNVLCKEKLPDATDEKNILEHPERWLPTVKSVFDGLNRMSWESFVTSRLSLLNLPSDLGDAVMKNRIKYTKAQAIAKIKDDSERREVLERAIASGWSLKQIKDHVKSLMGEKATPERDPEPIPKLTDRLDAINKHIKREQKKNGKAWQNPQIQERLDALDALLTELETIFGTQDE